MLSRNVFVYANVSLNLIDGSTIWVQSVTEVLAGFLGCNVFLLSRDDLDGRGITPLLKKLSNVTVLTYSDFADIKTQHPNPGDRFGVEKIVKRLDAEKGIDRILIRDPEVARTIARVAALSPRLWAYVLENPSLELSKDRSPLAELAEAAGGLIVQSETQRGLLEAVFPQACGKTSVLPPMVMPVRQSLAAPQTQDSSGPVRFIYSGKYSRDWNVEAFFDVPSACGHAGIEATVTMLGDKVHNEKSDPGFRSRILQKFKITPGVLWLGAMDREMAIAQSAGHDLGLCWRTDALNDSLEISTKFLEFASMAVPAVVNRTATYEALLGADYPYFVERMSDVVSAASSVTTDRELHQRMRERCRALADGFSYEKAAERLHNAMRLGRSQRHPASARRPKVLVASHDLKFLDAALKRLADETPYVITYDRWRSTSNHHENVTAQLLRDSDIIFCEWCVGQAVWYSQRKLPHQKLFIRLHRFEAFTNFPKQVAADAIDGIVVVSDHFRDICVKEFGWPADRIVVLPQYCIADQLRREKHLGAERTLGFVGINGFHHKRFDRALEILRLVRRSDPGFRMRVRSAMPWEFSWIWKDNNDERAKFEALFREIEGDRELREAIIFDRPGANMAEWYRNVGYILSTSETEGCHTTIAEGICSGAEPIVINWPGAKSVYRAASVYETVEEMAEAILKDSRGARSTSRELQDWGARNFDIARTVAHLDGWFSSTENADPKHMAHVE